MKEIFENPFRPGAGHKPPYLAGREKETEEFMKLLVQKTILENFVLTGLRGVGKTVLLDTLKPRAIEEGWLWVGTDLSESASVSEDNIAIRLIADLAVVTSGISIERHFPPIGFGADSRKTIDRLDYKSLMEFYHGTPGLVSDKLKYVMEIVWMVVKEHGKKGVIFAYDEAQNLSDQAIKEQYPLSLLLDLFQSIQKKDFPFMLVLTGLPTLFPKLVEARTFAERMFRVVSLDRLDAKQSRDAILKPIEQDNCPVELDNESVVEIVRLSGGYPYFIQFICKEVYDSFIQKEDRGETMSVPTDDIVRKLDTDFFAGRWNRVTDRQRDLMTVAAQLRHDEFTGQEIADRAETALKKGFGSSQINQMLSTLCDTGLVFRNRHGRYSFAVPMLGEFILRQEA
jgi:hypothetical protein